MNIYLRMHAMEICDIVVSYLYKFYYLYIHILLIFMNEIINQSEFEDKIKKNNYLINIDITHSIKRTELRNFVNKMF